MQLHPANKIQETLRKMAAAHAAAMAASEEAMRLLSAEFEAVAQPQIHAAISQTSPSDRPVIDRAMLSVLFQGRSCFLGNTLPFRLLDRLLRRPNQFVSYEQLQDDVWNSMPSPESIRSVVKELRRKLRCAGMDGLANAIDGKVARHYSLTLIGVS